MPIGIKGRLLFQLQINNKEIPLQQNQLEFFHLVESVRLHLPMVSMRIIDATKFFSRNDILVDGAPIKITLGVEDKKFIFQMRMFNHKEKTIEGAQIYSIWGYLDVPQFWNSSMVSIIRGTASTALKQVCSTSGLTFEGPSTNDSQLWIPYNRKCTEFSRYITSRSYIETGSCMQMGVTTGKVMRLVNVSDFDKMPIKQVFSNAPSQGQSLISDWNLINKSGFFNNVSGYKDVNVAQSNLVDDRVTKDAKVSKNTTKLMMNENVRTNVGQNRVTHGPIDVGNANENYQVGFYQNQRLGNLFSTGLDIVTPAVVNAELMEIVNCQISRPGAEGITAVSGKYMITSKVFYVSNNNFYQKLEVFRHGLNDKSEKTQT